jgi:cytochrome P450
MSFSDHSLILLVLVHSVGGADTTSAMMAFWTLAMLAYPETQARAHAELDAVVGRARLPTFADYQHLPCIRAMIKELLRWRPIVLLITPHRSTGCFYPKARFVSQMRGT